MEKKDYFWVNVNDVRFLEKHPMEAVGEAIKAAYEYMATLKEPNDLSPAARPVFELFKKRIDDTNNGFDPYA